MADAVQGGIFGGLNFQPLGWDAPTSSQPDASSPLSLPTLPSLASEVPAIGGSVAQGAAGLSSAASAAGITGGSVAPAATTGSTTAATGATVAGNWFARIALGLLGLIFIAVGISQFGGAKMVLEKAAPIR